MSSPTKSLEEIHSSIDTTQRVGWYRKLFAFAGPAYMVSVGYMDPGNWATDIAAGSGFGYELIWVLMMSNIIALILQSNSARLGIVYGYDLAQASRLTYPRHINLPLYVLAEIAIAACDLAEVMGLAIGLQLIFHIPILYGVTIAIFDCLLLLVILKYGIRKMEAIIISLIFIIGAAFFVQMILSKPDAAAIAHGFIPIISNNLALYIAIGIIGATVMPHNLYLHSALVQTRKFDHDKKGIKSALRFNFIDTSIALNLAFFVNAGILILAAAVFYRNGYFGVADLKEAQGMLQPLLGSHLAPILFAVALIASGQSSTITGTLAGQIVMEGYINLRISPWLRRLISRLLAVVPAFIVISMFGEGESGKLLILSQVVLSMQLGFAMIPLIHFVSDKTKMKDFVIGFWMKLLSWVCVVIILALNIKLIYDSFIDLFTEYPEKKFLISIILYPVCAYIAYLLSYITFIPLLSKLRRRERKQQKELELLPVNSFKKIALAVDFSSHDSKTISQALAVGHKNTQYLLIHVVESATAIFFASQATDKEVHEDMMQLEKYAASLKEQGYDVSVELGYGNRVRAIKELTEKFDANLLVMGAHGHSGLKDLIFGETINAIRHRVKIPVLAVK